MGILAFLWGGLVFCLLVLMYTYIGYPVLLAAITWTRSTPAVVSFDEWPSVTMIVAAHNEATVIGDKLENVEAVEYPGEFDCIFVSDSTDETDEIVRQRGGERVTLVSLQERRGKSYAINRAVEAATGEIIVFSDANTIYEPDAVRELVGPLNDPSVGCTTGRLRLQSPEGMNAETVYWRYELSLRRFETRLGTTVSVNGGLLAVRRVEFNSLPEQALTDDAVIAFRNLSAGRRVIFVPDSIATEATAPGIWDEFDRRVRIGVGNFQTLTWFLGLLSPKEGIIAVQFLSHKVLRWLAPGFLLLAALITLALALSSASTLAWGILGVELLAGAFAFIGAVSAQARRVILFKLPAFFIIMNLALVLGFCRYITGPSIDVWESNRR